MILKNKSLNQFENLRIKFIFLTNIVSSFFWAWSVFLKISAFGISTHIFLGKDTQIWQVSWTFILRSCQVSCCQQAGLPECSAYGSSAQRRREEIQITPLSGSATVPVATRGSWLIWFIFSTFLDPLQDELRATWTDAWGDGGAGCQLSTPAQELWPSDSQLWAGGRWSAFCLLRPWGEWKQSQQDLDSAWVHFGKKETNIRYLFHLGQRYLLTVVAALTNHHQLGGLTQQNRIFSWFWRLENWTLYHWKSGCQLTPENLVKNLFLVASSFWWPPAFLGLGHHHSSLQGQHLLISLFLGSHHFPLPVSAEFPSASLLWGYMWSHLRPTGRSRIISPPQDW